MRCRRLCVVDASNSLSSCASKGAQRCVGWRRRQGAHQLQAAGLLTGGPCGAVWKSKVKPWGGKFAECAHQVVPKRHPSLRERRQVEELQLRLDEECVDRAEHFLLG